MAYVGTNPVVVGAATKKTDFDIAFENGVYLKSVLDGGTSQSVIFLGGTQLRAGS